MRRPVSVKDVFLLLSCKDVFSFCFLFPSCGFLRIRAGPPLSPSFHPHSWLSDFRSVHGGRSQYSRCCYLIIDLGSRLSTEAWPGPRRSEERRVGKECRSGGGRVELKKRREKSRRGKVILRKLNGAGST